MEIGRSTQATLKDASSVSEKEICGVRETQTGR